MVTHLKKHWSWILGGVALMLYFILMATAHTPAFADALRGIEAAQSFFNGAPFNHISYVNPDAPDELMHEFIAWWTPGQYLLPMLFYSIGSNWTAAFHFTIILSLLLGAYGWIRLWKREVSLQILGWLIVFLILNRNFYWHTLLYMGGDLLLFAILPYFIYHMLYGKKVFEWLPLWILAGFVAKASFLVFVIPILIWKCYPIKDFKKTLVKLLPSAISLIIIWFLYLNQGHTPNNTMDTEGYSNLPHRMWNGWIYGWAAPIAIPFWVWSALESVWKNAVLSEWVLYMAFLIGGFISIYLLFPRKKMSQYHQLAIAVYVFFVAFFAVNQMSFKAISFEARHFYPLALITLPIVIKRLPKFVLSILLIIALVDVYRVYSLHKDISNRYCQTETLMLPYCIGLDLPENAIFITDKWDALPGIKNTHKMALELAKTENNNGHYRLITGIETPDRPVFSTLGPSERPKIGVFFTLKMEDVLSLELDAYHFVAP